MGMALLDFYNNNYSEDIVTYTSIAGEDILPLPHMFRSFQEMPKLEQRALGLAKGKVLDIGCGAGIHSLYLQEKGLDVKGIDISKGAVEVCKKRGIKQVEQQSIFDVKGEKFDTILALMNGIGVCGKLSKLNELLIHLKGLLNEDGSILTDSSDISYMFDEPEYYLEKSEVYFGEVKFQIFYKELEDDPFDWVYIDFETLKERAKEVGLTCKLILKGKHFDYLAELKKV